LSWSCCRRTWCRPPHTRPWPCSTLPTPLVSTALPGRGRRPCRSSFRCGYSSTMCRCR
jgi:hypothetical protein